MIWRLMGYDETGEDRPIVERLVSADFIKDGTVILVCPLDEPMSSRETEATYELLRSAGIKAVVFGRPIQVWKIEPATLEVE